jgi:hypothetical protein
MLQFKKNVKLLHEEVWGSGIIAPPFLINVLDGGA